jgi:type I restriction enzyme S subunit
MGEWKEYKLGDVSKFLNGRAYKATEFREEGTPIIRIQNLTGIGNQVYSDLKLSEDKYIDKGDLVYAWSATFGPFIWKGQKSIYHYHIWKILCNEKLINKYFLYYHLLNKSDGLKDSGNGTLFTHITKELMESFVIKLPSISEQLSITRILRNLDDKIDLLHRQNKTLEQLAETLFRQWFPPSQEFRRAGVEEADESWEEKILEELIQFNPTEKINRANEYTFYDMRCLSDNSMCINKGEKRIASSATCFRNDDVLLAKITPCLENGKTGFVMHLQENEIARGSTEFIVMRSKSRVNAYYIYCLSRSSEFRDSAILSMTGTSGRQRVQIDLLKNYSIYYNEIKIEEFGKIVKPYFEKIKINQIQIRTLTQLRDTLLPKLMSGEIRLNCDLCD